MLLRRCERRKNGKTHTSWALVESYRTARGSRQRLVVQAGVEVKLVPGPDGAETFVLARSADRRQKEAAIHRRFVERFEAALGKMQAEAASGRLKDLEVANRRLGRFQQKCWRASGAFAVTIRALKEPRGKARLEVSWKRNAAWSQWAALSEGCYLLRTNLNETDPATLWKRYIQLTEAEWAFRITKDELEIRPIWHQTTDRVLAHILVCFLAYVLWKAFWPSGCGAPAWETPRGRSWKNSPRSKAATWCCRPKPSRASQAGRSGSGA
jgi:hypothetical protein